MAKKLSWSEVEKLPRIYIRKSFKQQILKLASSKGISVFEAGCKVVSAGLDAI